MGGPVRSQNGLTRRGPVLKLSRGHTKSLYLKICNTVNFEAIKNLSEGSLPIAKTKLFGRGIRKKLDIGLSLFIIQKWRCLSELHHSTIGKLLLDIEQRLRLRVGI